MCGRFAFYSPHEAVGDYFDLPPAEELKPRYNIAPSQTVPLLRKNAVGSRELAMLRWGLVPSWARDPAVGHRMINARAETVAEKPSYRAAFRRRRCAILADGFYEWQAVGSGPKQPWFISTASGGPFLMAGLWEHWDKGDTPLETCTIITTAASEQMRSVHHRMPVILSAAVLDDWLSVNESGQASEILNADPVELRLRPVSRAVNNPAHDGPELIREAEVPDSISD